MNNHEDHANDLSETAGATGRRRRRAHARVDAGSAQLGIVLEALAVQPGRGLPPYRLRWLAEVVLAAPLLVDEAPH